MGRRNYRNSTEIELSRSQVVAIATAEMLEVQGGHAIAVEHTGVGVARLGFAMAATDQTLREQLTDMTDNSRNLTPAEARAGSARYLEEAAMTLQGLQQHGNRLLVADLLEYERRAGR